MFKKQVISVLLVLVLVLSVVPMNVKAVGTSSTTSFNVTYPEPATGDHNGYISVLYQNPVSGIYSINTYFWTIFPFTGDNPDVPELLSDMKIEMTANSITFTPQISGTSIFDWSLAEFGSEDTLYIHKRTDYGVLNPTATYTYTNNNLNIIGYLFGGNVGGVYSHLTKAVVPEIHWSDSVDASALMEYFYLFLHHLNAINADCTDIYEQIVEIYNQNVSTNQKLDEMIDLYNSMISEQEETNSWLEKIFNFLEEKDEKDKEAATQQGNQSTADIDNMITDDSAGFVDSLGALSSSMSYTGTSCSWTFPTVKLPAISGVMDEVTLVESKEIDFTYWVNSIPSGILLLIQSVCTVALIVFCFKELYGAISYVLTLKGGGNE